MNQESSVKEENKNSIIHDSKSDLITLTSKEIQHIADQLLPKGLAYDWNHALMDFSASVLANEKVPIKKQSKFAGSNRYFRGQIVKLLIARKRVTLHELATYLQKDERFLQVIIAGLIRDGLVSQNGTVFSLV